MRSHFLLIQGCLVHLLRRWWVLLLLFVRFDIFFSITWYSFKLSVSVEHLQKPSIIKKWSLKLCAPRRWVQILLRWLNPLFILTINYTSMRLVRMSCARLKKIILVCWHLPLFLQAAIGILTYSQQNLEVQLKESWYRFISLLFSFFQKHDASNTITNSWPFLNFV